MIRRLLVFFFCLAFAGPVTADHLIGADWQMRALGAGRFAVRLTLYTDPVGGNTNAIGDPSISLAAYEHASGPGTPDRLVEVFSINRTTTGNLPGGGPDCAFANQLVRAITYEVTLTLAPGQYRSANGYYLVWERCCRNQLVTNLDSPQSTGLVSTLQFPAVAGIGQRLNSAPQFQSTPPGVAFCVGQPNELRLTATDADGDSLAYALVAPLAGTTSQAAPIVAIPNSGPYQPARYATGFSAAQPFGNALAFDTRTGLLQSVPTQPGTYIMAVSVSEYRDRRKIGENRREFELTVVSCPTNAPPSLARRTPLPDTVRITGPADRCLTILATDADAGQTLTVRALDDAPVTISPPRFSLSDPATPQEVAVCWRDCAQPARQLLTLVVTDDACAPPRSDTLRIPVRVAPAPNQAPTLRLLPSDPITPLPVVAGQSISFEVEISDPDAPATQLLSLSLRIINHPELTAGLSATPASGPNPFRSTIRWTPPCETAQAANAPPYRLALQATDDACQPRTDTTSVAVQVLPLPTGTSQELPNIITPTAQPDALNDCFSLPAGLATSAQQPCGAGFQAIRIFNRWGRQVYHSTDPTFCWDAHGLSAGTYFYQIQWTSYRQRGLLTVIR